MMQPYRLLDFSIEWFSRHSWPIQCL